MKKQNHKSKKKILPFIIILLFSSFVVSFLVKSWVEEVGEKVKENIYSQSQPHIEMGRGDSVVLTDDELDQAIKENPTNADLYNIKGNRYLKNGEFQKAIKEFNKAININPNYSEPYNGKGVAYRNLGKYYKAIENYTKAIELYPSFYEAYNNRGVVFIFLVEYGKACSDFQRACELGSCQKLEMAKQKGFCE